jgi:predicted small secreted protein
MKSQQRRRMLVAVALALGACALTGCNTVGSAAADLGLAGAGGVAGYHVSDGKVGGARRARRLGLSVPGWRNPKFGAA